MDFRTTIILLLAMTLLSACAGQTPIAAPTTSVSSSTAQSSPAQGLPARVVAPTPVCNALQVTPSATEGPYYKANPPERLNLVETDTTGERMVITGFVLTQSCKPIARARVDFWQADDRGEYDNAGYKWRGYQMTDDVGRYALETVMPGLYPGRTRHFHVKVQVPNVSELTTQLYFPSEPSNARDSIFSPKLVMAMSEMNGVKVGVFNFVLNVK